MSITEYKTFGECVHSQKLLNGLSVFVIPKRGFNKRYAFFATDYGGADRRFKLGGNWIDTPEGVAHFLEHKMFDTEDGNALTTLSSNGASPNAFTSTDITAYYFECIEKFDENLKTLLQFVSTPYFTAESVEKEQGIIGQEIKMVEDNPDYAMYYGLLKSLFKHNPLRDSVAGTVESISKITSDTLYDCHKVFYNPSNMALCVAGDVDPESIYKLAEELLPKTAGEIPLRDYGPAENLTPENREFSANMDVSLPMFLAGCKCAPVSKGPESFKKGLVGALALEILAGDSSPLYYRLYSGGHVNHDFSADYESVSGAAYMMFGGECREPEFVFNEVLKEIKLISQNGPDLELFERTKKSMLGKLLRLPNSFDALCNNYTRGYFRGYDAFTAPEIHMAITPRDIIDFIRDNLSAEENMAISIIRPRQ